MAAVILALAASAGWGLSDFLGGLRARTLSLATVMGVSGPAGLVAIGTVIAIRADSLPDASFVPYSVVAGAGGAVAIACLYKALAVGTMGVVAPITATAPIIPVVVGLARGERPSAVQYAGMGLALVGVLLVGREAEQQAVRRRVAAGAGYAVVAAIGFGTTQLAIDKASESDPYWATFVLRAAFVAAIFVGIAIARERPAPPRSALPTLFAIGALDVGATCAFAIATSKGLLSVVAVLGSMYPVVVIVLAWTMLKERLTRVQLAGGAIALGGAALLAAG